jgi:glycosyltransferase involved in cell wall biosynthesis
LNQEFKVEDSHAARAFIAKETNIDVSNGYLLHVGGNQWYKNRTGVIEIYNAWRTTYKVNLPLIFIGATPNRKLLDSYKHSPYKADIHFLVGKSDTFVKKAYCGASVFLFPSLAEGFGWPIAEAMSSGCPVVTTVEAPMAEVGGSAARYISRRPYQLNDKAWAEKAAGVIDNLLNLSVIEHNRVIELGVNQARKFDPLIALDAIERVYQHILANSV